MKKNIELAERVKNKYLTVVLTYWNALQENYLDLVTQIDSHVLYNMRSEWVKVPIIDSFYRMQVSTKLLNFLDSIHGLGTCQQSFRNILTDHLFEEFYNKGIKSFPIILTIMIEIRNKFHHSQALPIEFRDVLDPRKSVASFRAVGYKIADLLKLGDWNKEQTKLLRSLDYFDAKAASVQCFETLKVFNQRYQTQLRKLIQRKTGYDITITL